MDTRNGYRVVFLVLGLILSTISQEAFGEETHDDHDDDHGDHADSAKVSHSYGRLLEVIHGEEGPGELISKLHLHHFIEEFLKIVDCVGEDEGHCKVSLIMHS